MISRKWLFVVGIPVVLLCLQYFAVGSDTKSAWARPADYLQTAGTLPGTIPELFQTVVITPMMDGTLYESTNGALANGAGEYFFVGKTDAKPNSLVRRGLVKFALPATIPAGSTIITASLKLTVTDKGQGGPRNVTLHKVQTAWGEGNSNAGSPGGQGTTPAMGDATWIHTFFSTATWNNPGGDYVATASATNSVDASGMYEWTSTGRTVADVQSWLNTPATNHGWLLKGDESTEKTAKRFDSKDNSSAANHPRLVIVYQPPLYVQYFPRVFKPANLGE